MITKYLLVKINATILTLKNSYNLNLDRSISGDKTRKNRFRKNISKMCVNAKLLWTLLCFLLKNNIFFKIIFVTRGSTARNYVDLLGFWISVFLEIGARNRLKFRSGTLNKQKINVFISLPIRGGGLSNLAICWRRDLPNSVLRFAPWKFANLGTQIMSTYSPLLPMSILGLLTPNNHGDNIS